MGDQSASDTPSHQVWFTNDVVDTDPIGLTQRIPDCLSPVWLLIDQIPLHVADRPIAEVDDEPLGWIRPICERAVVHFDRDRIGWLSPPACNVRLGEPGCKAKEVTGSEGYEPEVVHASLCTYRIETPTRQPFGAPPWPSR